MSAHIIPSKREAYAEFLKNLAADGQPDTAEVLATLLYDADRVAVLVEQVARLTEQVDALTTDLDNARTLAEAALERVEVLEQRAGGDMMANVPTVEDERDAAAWLSYQQALAERRNRSLPVAS
jgi:hypothetical protein